MKKFCTITLIAVMIMTGLCRNILAQEKNADQARKEEVLRAIEEQKKALNEQTKEIEKEQKELERQLSEDFGVNVDQNGNQVRIYRRGDRTLNADYFRMPNVPVVPMVPDIEMSFHMSDNIQRTSFEFSKSIKETSFKRDYSFDVDKAAKSVSMAVNGDCKQGEIRIKIITPQGKTYSDVVIDNFGNMNVRKSFNISETENQDKTGEWKMQIDAEKATGYFRLSFQTY
ncbi:MAG TPA: hypothetical protein VK213_02605 [Bacteroidales bacterium]|nr:hypothetical protein [Bacteroidales bacterium]